jgi:hypothetical protein
MVRWHLEAISDLVLPSSPLLPTFRFGRTPPHQPCPRLWWRPVATPRFGRPRVWADDRVGVPGAATRAAETLERLGDDRDLRSIRRSLERMAASDARVLGEMRVVLNLLARSRKRRAERQKMQAEAEAGAE